MQQDIDPGLMHHAVKGQLGALRGGAHPEAAQAAVAVVGRLGADDPDDPGSVVRQEHDEGVVCFA